MTSARAPFARETSGALDERVIPSFDGTPLAVQSLGNPNGEPLLLANGVGATVDAYRYITAAFGDRFRFFSWDYRGLFGSGRPVEGYRALSIADHAKDALAVLGHFGVARCHALGWSMGVQVLLEVFRTDIDRFASLVLHNGVAGRPFRSLFRIPALEKIAPPVLRSAQRVDALINRGIALAVDAPQFLPVAARLGLVDAGLDRDLFMAIARGFKRIDMHLYMELLLAMGAHDASDVLSRVRCPTLVLASGRDAMTPLERAEELARAIDGAALAIVPRGTHYAAAEFPALTEEILGRFWADPRVPRIAEHERPT